MNEMPAAGSRWRHYKGGLYEVLAVATEERSGVPLVVYRSLEDGRVWARHIEEWQEDAYMTAARVFVSRFRPADAERIE